MSDATSKAISIERFEKFFAAVSILVARAEKQQQELERTEATRFNVFEFIEPDENKLSDILADLLNPSGSHGQKDTFLRLLIEQLGVGSRKMSLVGARVEREAPTHGILKFRRRIDVLVNAGILVAIENKVDAAEQTDQIQDYLEHLTFCSRTGGQRFVLVYLTPTGCAPDSFSPAGVEAAKASGQLQCWSYRREFRDWLKLCRKNCAAPKIAHFLADYIGYIESTMKNLGEVDETE